MIRSKVEWKALAVRVAKTQSEIPMAITLNVVDLMVDMVASALAEGREVNFRGFGRFIPRFYENDSSKKTGLLFHASPRLTDECNKRNAADNAAND